MRVRTRRPVTATLLDLVFETVVVENHPKLCGDAVLRFRDRLRGRLEVALGLETAHEGVLALLNKRMTTDDFARAAALLRREGVDVRAFILLRPPFLSEEEGVEWALRSVAFAFDAGVQCCSVVPVRAGNGKTDLTVALREALDRFPGPYGR